MTRPGRSNRRALRTLALAVACVVAACGQAVAQSTATAPADTAVARFSWTDRAAPQPIALRVVPTAVALGDLVTVVLELAPGSPPVADLAAGVDVAWLEPVSAPPPRELAATLAALPAAAGPRVVTHWRVYRLGPWRAAWADGPAGPAHEVRGRLDDPQRFLPVRDPRRPGGLPRWLPWLLAILVVALGVWLLRRRWRGRPAARRAQDLPLAPIAWLAAAQDLRDLDLGTSGGDQDGGVDVADGRRYLDRLASIVRRFVADRLHVAAPEMTAGEVALAARRAGWTDAHVADLVEVLARCDRLRYAPPAVSHRHCRECLLVTLAGIERLREQPRWSPVAPASLAAATTAWQELRARHPGRPIAAGVASDEGGAC